MRTFANLIALTVLAAAGARAGDISVVFDDPAQSGSPGDTLQFFGTISNTGTDPVYLNGDDLSLVAGDGDFTTNDLFFFNVPISVDGGGSSGDIELFDVTVSEPFVDAFTTYSGTYTLLGGVDGNAQDNLAEVGFSVDVGPSAPEPATLALLGTGLALIWGARRGEDGGKARFLPGGCGGTTQSAQIRSGETGVDPRGCER